MVDKRYMGKKKYSVYIPEFRTPIEPQRKILDPIAEIKTDKAKDETELISRRNHSPVKIMYQKRFC